MESYKFYCPSDSTHFFSNYYDFRQHLIKCRLLQDKTAYICKYSFTHMFLTSETRDVHESHCPDKDQGSRSNTNYLKLGTKHRENILSSKFDENHLFPKIINNNANNIHSIPSNNNPNINININNIPTNALHNTTIINPLTNINISNNPMSSIIINNNPSFISHNMTPIVHINNNNNVINNSVHSKNNKPNHERLLSNENRPVDAAETLRNLKKEKIYTSEPITNNITITTVPTPISQKLESLVHTLIFDNDKRLEIIVRRRSTVNKLKMKEFSITEFKTINYFQHIINEKFTQEVYENEYFIGEYTLYGDHENKIQLYGQFLHLFESGDYVAVNNYYKDTHNEVLLICTNKTKYLGDFIKKGDISLLLFKYTTLYNKVRIFQGDAALFKSPWIEPLRKEGNITDQIMERDIIKKERRDDDHNSSIYMGYKKEILEGRYKNPFHYYNQSGAKEIELTKEELKKQESSIDIEIDELEKKCTEYRNLLTKQTEQYKNKLNELELENQKKKGEIKQYVQMINLLEKNKLDHINDLNNHDLLYKEDKKQFEIKFNEELRKQKEKYHEIYHKRVMAYEAELLERKIEFPVKEKEYEEFLKDFDEKRMLYDQQEKKFNEIKGKLNEMKKIYEKLVTKENFLEMHKKFKGSNIADDSESYDQDKCNICLKERRNIVYLPCKHFVACEKCVAKAKEQEVDCCLSCKREVKQLKIIKWD